MRILYTERYLNAAILLRTHPNFSDGPTNTRRRAKGKWNETTAHDQNQRAKDLNQHQTRTNIKDIRNHRHAGRPKPTPCANHQKEQTKPPRTRHRQRKRRQKRPSRNQPQALDPFRKHSIVLTGRPSPARGLKYLSHLGAIL